jgi:DNA processing protein
MTDAERIAVAALLRITEPAVPGVVRLVREHGPEAALAMRGSGADVPGVDTDGLRHRLRDTSGERDLERAAAAGARLVCRGDEEWPASLDDLSWVDRDCLGLWVRGPLRLADAVERAVSVVGTRVATDYGVHVAGELAGGLAERGWTVVSGLAYGIDGVAHRAALALGGPTVAVLASGVDMPYPSGHQSLYERISAEGLVCSEHPPGASPQRHRFLVRNRVIAALSAGTVVVEAALRSGARSTAAHAAAINRHVMVVPGPITSATSAGCHQLLRDRPDAVVVTRVDDIVEQCGHLGELGAPVTGPAEARDALGPVVARVFEGVPVVKHAPATAIAATAGVALPVAEAALAALAATGLVEERQQGWAMTRTGRDDRRSRRSAAQPLPLDWW